MRITGLAKLVKLLIAVCNVIAKYRVTIRAFVPDDSKTVYDGALDQILAACDVLRAIDYNDSNASTNPLWGAR